jgi:hypothetical protein
MSRMPAAVLVLELRGWIVVGGKVMAVEVLEMRMFGLWLTRTRTVGHNMQQA